MSPSPATSGSRAENAEVLTTRAPSHQAYLTQLADDAEQAVPVIEEKIAGMQATLRTAKAEAKRLRGEARKGGAE